MTVLSISHLTTSLSIDGERYKIIDDLSFDLQKAETLAIVGESGSGKSMTALSILGILPSPPALKPHGQVLFQGENLLTLSESKMRKIRGAKIAMIFQDPMSAFNPVFTIGSQLIEMACHHLSVNVDHARALALQALEEVSLSEPVKRMQQFPHQMSGGMLQRAMIAMAIICNPMILIADEPTTALDVTIQAQILQMLTELKKKKGLSILLITHDMGVVSEIADRVIVMYAGQKVEEGTALDIFEKPLHPYTQALFQARPDKPIKKGKFPTIVGTIPSFKAMPQGCRFSPRCPFALEICHTKEPPVFKKSNREAKCWLYEA